MCWWFSVCVCVSEFFRAHGTLFKSYAKKTKMKKKKERYENTKNAKKTKLEHFVHESREYILHATRW